MRLKPLTLSNLELVRLWRNECLESLRTPFPLTQEMQEKFYYDVICNRQSNSRYWGIHLDDVSPHEFIGMCGIENIEWENRLGEISFILNPKYHGKGLGEQALILLLDKGFYFLNLDNIWGECYLCNEAQKFWIQMVKKFNGTDTFLPNRKYWNGRYYDSIYFNFNKTEYYEN